jgi:uncharacterized protein YndB with AHSA1/START domain
MMSEIITQFDVTAPAATVWQALTTRDGIRGWWTTQAEVPQGTGAVLELRFPDAPISWDLRVDEADENERLHWHCIGGPPPWVDTDILFRLAAAPDGGTRVLFDHVGWKDAEEMVRIVTFGWVQMFLQLKGYAESGKPQPFFDF